MELIFFKEAKDKYSSLEELLEDYISKHAPSTYFRSNGTLQCNRNCNRSIDDLILLCNNYLEDISAKDIVVALKNLSQKDDFWCYVVFVCLTIKKPVLTKSKCKKSNYYGYLSNEIIYKPHLNQPKEYTVESEYTLDQLNDFLND